MPSEKQSRERKENIASILRHIRAQGPKSRRQLCDELNLSWGCVSELASILLQKNVLQEESPAKTGAKGRSPAALKLNGDIHFLGVDINLQGLRACLCDLSGEKIASYSAPLQTQDKDAFLQSVFLFTRDIMQKHPNITGIGFAMQGVFSAQKALWEFPAENKICIDFSEDIARHYAVPVIAEHDPNCILYGFLENNDPGKMVVRLDSGIGAAIHTEDGFFRSGPLELGHTVVNEHGQRLHHIFSLCALHKAVGPEADPQNAAVQQYFAKAGGYLGTALGNICNLLQLQEIYLCGDMVRYYPLFQKTMQEHYAQTVLSTQMARISPIAITDAAYGAAKLAMDQF